MHELSMMQQVLETVEGQASAQNASRVHSVTLRIGALSGVVPDALRFAFECLAPGTRAEGAALVIEEPPVPCYCRSCQRAFETKTVQFQCPACGGVEVELRGGQEMTIVSMEVS